MSPKLAKFRVGEHVRYTRVVFKGGCSDPNALAEWKEYEQITKSPYIGNVGIIVKVSPAQGGWPTTYAIDSIDTKKPMPYHAWYDEEEIESCESEYT